MPENLCNVGIKVMHIALLTRHTDITRFVSTLKSRKACNESESQVWLLRHCSYVSACVLLRRQNYIFLSRRYRPIS